MRAPVARCGAAKRALLKKANAYRESAAHYRAKAGDKKRRKLTRDLDLAMAERFDRIAAEFEARAADAGPR